MPSVVCFFFFFFLSIFLPLYIEYSMHTYICVRIFFSCSPLDGCLDGDKEQ